MRLCVCAILYVIILLIYIDVYIYIYTHTYFYNHLLVCKEGKGHARLRRVFGASKFQGGAGIWYAKIVLVTITQKVQEPPEEGEEPRRRAGWPFESLRAL